MRLAETMRMTRTMMLEVLRQDYIRTAWSKGLKERVVVIRHTIKNALIPIVTLIGLQLAPPDRGLRYLRGNICFAGDRSFISGCTRGQRLPGGPGNQPVFRHRGGGDQSLHRPDLCFLGPQGSV